MSSSSSSPDIAAPRLGSIDAYRGFVMLLMMAEVLRLHAVAEALPDSSFWRVLAFHQRHSAWVGCSLHDLIQPSFSFLVGVALPFSLASRAAHGQPPWKMTLHAGWRALVLVLLGVFLRSVGRDHTYWTFEDTLTQIGLGYPLLYALGKSSPRVQGAALAVILIGYWALWAFYPLPGPGYDFAAAGADPGWRENLHGFAAHWNKGTNPAAAFDRWFLNLFPRERPFVANSGGYATLSFIPTLGTMLLGLIAGRWLKSDLSAVSRVMKMLVTGLICTAAGLILQATGLCPIVKPVWTPAWVLFSGGLCFGFLAAFYALIDGRGWRRWAFPLTVIGTNSIAAYLMAHLMEGFVIGSLHTHLGKDFGETFGEAYAPLIEGGCVLLVFWLLLWWMFRRKIFLKV